MISIYRHTDNDLYYNISKKYSYKLKLLLAQGKRAFYNFF